ncbi:MAG: amidohydrolase family protein, partial [Calditrichaeota bacterium]|nr:amidohydrolase family protein [Calditrichota bacterium]
MNTKPLKYFDSFAAIGRRAGKDAEAPWTTEHLLEDMVRCRINAALVFSHQAKDTHPLVGNGLVVEECEKHPRLFPCWVGLPHHTGEFPRPDKLMQEMEENNVRALKIFPRIYEFAVDEPTLGELFSTMQEAGLLLIVDAGHHGEAAQIEWPEVSWLCENYPRLNVLLHSVRWEATRTLAPLATRFPNLHFEFSNYQGNRMLEFWSDLIGHERLLFGSETLIKSVGAARAYVDYADLTDEQRRAVAGENLQRLLRIAELPAGYESEPVQDKIMLKALHAEPVDDMLVIDAHAHIIQKGTWGASRVVMIQGDAAGVVQRNRRIGVDKTCVSAWTAIWGDYKLGNEDTRQALIEFPDEIVGYAALDPNYVTDWEKECKYYHEECGFLGLKPYYPQMKIPYNDDRFAPWYEYANTRHLFCLLHYSDDFKAEVSDIAGRYPNISFLLAHSGTSWEVAREHVKIAKEFSNCFLEITFTAVMSGIIEYMVREMGSERVLYGSDAPMRDPYPQFGWVAYADISE